MTPGSTNEDPSKAPVVVISIDLHRSDRPADIEKCGAWLASAGLRGSFFVPTGMLEEPKFLAPLRTLTLGGHEIGSHTHHHDRVEVAALKHGGLSQLEFLRESKALFEDFFSRTPRTFRSPCWCGLGGPARQALLDLGYRVDSSATPQRASLLSNYPLENPWLFSPRRPYILERSLERQLLEVPTTTCLIPLGTAAVSILRRRAVLWFLELLMLEARITSRAAVVIQVHPSDFVDSGVDSAWPKPRLRDFIPRREGGLGLRGWIRERDPTKVFQAAVGVIERLVEVGGGATTFQEIYDRECGT